MAEVSQNPSRTVLVAVDNSEYSLEAFECEYSKKSNVNVPVHTQLLTCHLSRISCKLIARFSRTRKTFFNLKKEPFQC